MAAWAAVCRVSPENAWIIFDVFIKSYLPNAEDAGISAELIMKQIGDYNG